jgi:hypothetical protein
MAKRRAFAVLLLLLATAACSSGTRTTADVERDALQPLKQRYPDVVTGFDPKGDVLDVSIDMDALASMDEDKEDQLKRDAVAEWANAWRRGNPGRHSTLTLRIVDFRGNTVFTQTNGV